MPGVLVDSSVLLDILTEDAAWYAWSSSALERCASESPLFINAVIYAEVSIRFERIEDLEAALPAHMFGRLRLPWEAAFLAAKAFVQYRRQGGKRTSCLPDFFIGAHAAVSGLQLLTRDDSRCRTYFPTVTLVSPPAA
jgi:predicted nucleic acid-binding protein